MFCVCAYLLSASGRIVFPDDEIVYQTTAALYERGALDIEGIPRRTGEPKGQPTGTFGWARGPDGARYGFFGHALSVVALPMYGAGTIAAATAPPQWRHAIRSDHFFVHRRSPSGDWTRLFVSLTNCLIAPLVVLLAMTWVRQLGFSRAAGWVMGISLAFGTLLWPYTRTFLSEPLSTAALLAAAVALERHHRLRAQRDGTAARWLWAAALIVGWSTHIHLLNLVAVPAFAGYAFGPAWTDRRAMRREWGVALVLGATGVLALALSHAARFGSPFESGRHGLYSHFIVPGTELLALLVSPGRSLWLTSPILLGAVPGWRRFRERVPAAAWFSLALVASRLLFVASRSDWWGGWALGPRFLIPALPFALVPIVAAWDSGTRHRRLRLVLLLIASVALQAHLAQHSIFEWMLRLNADTPPSPGYLWVSHWTLRGSPAWGFASLRPDLLRVGAWQLARLGHPGMAWIFGAIGAVAVSSLAIAAWPGRSRLHPERGAGHAPPR